MTITSVGTAGATGTGVGITPALAGAHAGGFRGAAVADLSKPGTGVTFSPALSLAHPAGTPTLGNGTGVTFTPALASAHASGATVVGPTGTGITLAAPLQQAHAAGSAVGISGMTVPEGKSELSLWAVEAAPLIAGTDVVNMASQNLAVYTNKDVIAIDQDPLGKQASVVSNANGQWVLDKPLADGGNAIALFNAGDTPWTDATVSMTSLGLSSSAPYLARDLWAHSDATVQGTINAGTIAPHSTVLLRVSSASDLVRDQLTLVGAADGSSFASQLNAVLDAVQSGKTGTACNKLAAYVNHVHAQSGKSLPASVASQLTADAAEVAGLLGC